MSNKRTSLHGGSLRDIDWSIGSYFVARDGAEEYPVELEDHLLEMGYTQEEIDKALERRARRLGFE